MGQALRRYNPLAADQRFEDHRSRVEAEERARGLSQENERLRQQLASKELEIQRLKARVEELHTMPPRRAAR
jgi:predicted nuclease with TOPRIM domain